MSIHFSALASSFNLGPIVLILAVLGLIVLVLSKTTQFVKQQPPQAAPAAPIAPAVQPAAPRATAASPSPAAQVMQPAPAVSSGECSIFSVDDKSAAMIMAIVADGLNQPLNTLKFISIKEI